MPILRRTRVVSLLFATLAVLPACASTSGGGGDSTSGATRTVGAPGDRRSRDLLTEADIQEAGVGSTYDIVQRLRPAWLRTRSSGTTRSAPQYAIVYLDGTRIGGLEALRRVNSTDVQTIRYLSGPDATTRYGTGHEGGAILIDTKK